MVNEMEIISEPWRPIDPDAATVLVVEDTADNLFLFLELLKSDLKVKYCAGRVSGAQLFGLLAAQPWIKPDLIILDIQIPHEDGYAILEHIRGRMRLQATRVVACTASTSAGEVRKARAAGFNSFIGKPIDADKFPDQIRRILAGEELWEP
jgi:two-component system, cell cycle response regulator DivK